MVKKCTKNMSGTNSKFPFPLTLTFYPMPMPTFVRHNFASLFFLLLMSTASDCDWWDDFANSAHEKIVGAADWLRDKAAPTVREKFNGAKETLQDPETHEQMQQWVEEKALPTIKHKFEQFKEFVNDEVMPQVQKVAEAGAEAHRRRNTEKEEKVKKEDE